MNVIESRVNPTDATFKANRDRMQQLVKQLRDRLTVVRQGGGPKHLQRHREQGKLPVRDRLERLLDPGSPFLELSPLAAFDMYENDAPGGRYRHRHRSRLGPRSTPRRQRRDRQRRYLLSDDR